ncbi:hypothetical protein CH372_17290 [Leptospira meyeri]|uniref:protein-export chaperone SecB n=1 Tax=Leptospira meyeri TaxID=29508 RepID=UPI000C29EC34|nr:protein-export chaperone SecB [Leptospira meyeri]PKA10837.1 hypothetical protein CH372_17290 [Leptospira meyeri]PKA23957.1 hypothetical protein CH381_23150 [Leptospira sp. mixed culture ATI2-C-A1]
MNLRLDRNILHSLNIKRNEPKNVTGDIETKFKLNFKVYFPDDDPRLFAILFKIEIQNEDFDLNSDYHSFFRTDSDITKEFRESHFPSKNAPAIAFPFLRSFIGTITLNAGFRPVLLPSINFFNDIKTEDK